MVGCTGEVRAKQLTLEVRCFVSRYQRSRVFVNGCLIIRDNNNRTETSGKCSSANDLGANTVAPSGGRHRVLSYLGLWRRVVRCCECVVVANSCGAGDTAPSSTRSRRAPLARSPALARANLTTAHELRFKSARYFDTRRINLIL